MRAALDLASLWRAAAGADTYGQGYTPAASAPVTLVLLTDGGALVGGGGVASALSLPPGRRLPGCELTAQPFRWDVRLFAAQLRAPGVMNGNGGSGSEAGGDEAGATELDSGADPVAAMCEVTGGKCVAVRSLKGLLAWADRLAARPPA